MIPVATLRALVKVERFPEEMTKLRAFDAELHRIAETDPTARLSAIVDQGGFAEFTALVDEAKDRSATAHLGANVSKGEFATAAAEITALRDLSDKSIVQSVKVELDKESAAAVEAEKAALSGSAARPGASGTATLSAQEISNDMLGLRQWQLAHPNFWNVGPKTSALQVGADAAAAAPNGPESSVETSALLAEAASDTAAKTVAKVQRAADKVAEAAQPQDAKVADILASLAARGKTGEELRPGQFASKRPEMATYYRAHGYEPALGPDGRMHIYGAGGNPGSGDFGVAPTVAGGGSGGKGGGGGFWSTLTGGSGDDGESLAHRLLWGKGKWGFAGFGSLASFAGFGLEHAALTTGGLAGSATTAVIGGGGLLAAGALGKTLVGGGSDALVMHSTVAGVKALYEGWAEVEKVQAEYGKGSKQAVQAERSFKQTMEGLGGKKSVTAELGVAKEVDNLQKVWETASEGAKVDASKILDQVVGLGDAYAPKVAAAAEKNLTIVDAGLKPLFSWLEGPEGMGVWNQLEDEFAKTLPDGMHAVDQGVELLLKTIADASKYTGGFTESLDDFFTKWNSPQNFPRVEAEVGKLIADFRMWETLVKVLGHDLVLLFSQDAGSAKAIVTELTGMLEKLGEWEESTKGSADLHNIFTVHKEEALELLRLVPPLLSGFGSIYMTVAPPLVESVTAIARVFATLLEEIDELGPVARDGVGVLLVMSKLFGAKQTFGAFGELFGVKDAIQGIEKGLIGVLPVSEAAKSRMLGMVTTTDAQTQATERLAAAQDRLAASMDRVAGAGSAADATIGAEGAGTPVAAVGAGAAEEGAEGLGSTILGRAGEGAGLALAGGIGGSLIGGKAGRVVSMAGYGAGLGMLFGPEGAAVGGIGGAAVGGLLDLLDPTKQLAPLQKKLASTSKEAAAAMKAQEHAAQELAGAQGNLESAELAHKGATQAVVRAHQNLNKAIRQFGPDSEQARSAELQLSEAQHRDALTAHEAQEAHRLAGNAVRLYKHETEGAVRADEERIPPLQTLVKHLQAKLATEPENWSVLKQTVSAEEKLGKVREEANKVIAEAAEKVNPKYAQSLREIQPWAKELEKSFKFDTEHAGELHKALHALADPQLGGLHTDISTTDALGSASQDAGHHVKHSYEEMQGALGPFRTETRRQLGLAEGDVQNWSKATQRGVEEVRTSLGSLAGELGIGGAQFSTSGKKGAPSRQKKQDGGFIVPGTGTGDTFLTALPPGSFIENREAVRHFADGGLMPVALEPGERAYLPHEVDSIGRHVLEARNGEVPRFQTLQTGGVVEPQVAGPAGALTTMGNAAMGDAVKLADRYLAQHRPKHGAAGPISLSGGLVASPLQFAEYMLQAGFPATVKVIAEGLGTIMSESGFKVDNGQGPGGHIGPWAESPAFGSVKVREDPLGSTEAAFREWLSDGRSFWQAWGQWEAEQSGLAGGGAGAYGPQFRKVAEEAIADHSRRAPMRTGAAAALAHHHGLQAGGPVGFAAGGSIPTSTSWQPEKESPSSSSSKYKPKTNAQYEKERDHKSAQGAIAWATQRIGQSEPWSSQYPDAWCGDFLGDDMKAIGLTPPAGYPSAAAWGHYGTPLGTGDIQPGAIIDYDGLHVAMAISSDRMIQGNSSSGKVATSPIAESITNSDGTSGITAVRWPPYAEKPGAGSAAHLSIPKMLVGKYVTHKKGSTSKSGGTYAENTYGHYKVYTAKIKLPSGEPGSLQECEREIVERRHQLQEYRAAARQTHESPQTHHDIEVNVHALEARLRVLFHARTKLRRKKTETKYSKGLAAKLSGLTGYQDKIAEAEREYNILNQTASQIVGLEPLPPEAAPPLPENATVAEQKAAEAAQVAAEKAYVSQYAGYVEGQERPAYENVLAAEAVWRNTILGGEAKATGMERGWETEDRQTKHKIERINAFTEKVAGEAAKVKSDISAFKAANPKKELPEWITKEQKKLEADEKKRDRLRAELPMLRFKDTELRKVIGEARGDFWGGIGNGNKAVEPPVPPIPGSGSFEEALISVQGIHWPDEHSRMASLPGYRVKGMFGGAIWETQEAIEGLGLKIKQAGAGVGAGGGVGAGEESAAKTEREGLLEELLQQSHQREIVGEIDRLTLSNAHVLPYAGAYESGGMVAAVVGERGPEIVATRPGAYIHNASESRSMMGSPNIAVHYYEGDGHAEVEVDGRRIIAPVQKHERQSVRVARRRLARPGF